MRHHRDHRIICTPAALALGAALAACAGEPNAEQEHHTDNLVLATNPVEFCVEPTQTVPSPADSLAVATAGTELGYSLAPNGLQVIFSRPPAGGRIDDLTVRIPLDEASTNRRLPYIDQTFAGVRVRVQTGPVTYVPRGLVVLTTGGRPLAEMELGVSYRVRRARTGSSLGVTELAVLSSDGVVADHQNGPGSYAPIPGTCLEEAILRFGPFPAGMPAVKWPLFEGCDWSKCSDAALGWLQVHHNVWRANQMFAVLDGMHPAQRSYFWGRPGRDAGQNDVSLRSSPEYWYGSFDGDRYSAIREVMHDFSTIMTTAKTGSIKVRLSCPSYASNPGNVCFNSNAMAHHWVKGWINLCDSAFTDTSCNAPNPGDGVARSLHHEPLHHVFTHLNGIKALRDTHTHFHGNSCLSNPTTAAVYCETGNAPNNIMHFVNAGNSCKHLDKLAQTVDAHALFIQTIGDMVADGVMTHWPALTPQTPTPPNCFGDPGCQCEATDIWTDPDGDYSQSMHCPDNQGLAVCMSTTFNASDTVGICTLCDDFRGPGCPCNDLSAPCEDGFCFGDDTFAQAAGTGTCYDTPPPSWGCLADCEMLLGNGAFCMHDHPGGARCVPVATGNAEAHNCWNSGGHMSPQTLSCTMAPECLDNAACHALGYPVYFVCDGTQRCMPQP